MGLTAPELNGVLVWLRRIRQATRNDTNLEVRTLGCCNGDFAAPGWIDLWARNKADGRSILGSALAKADVFLINGCYDWLALIAQSRCLQEQSPSIIAFVHNDHDREYYDALTYYEALVDRFVAVSAVCGERMRLRVPHRASDVMVLPYFVPSPSKGVLDIECSSEISLVFAGRMSQKQKRIFDLVVLANELWAIGVPFQLSICGDGNELVELKERFAKAGHGGRIRYYGLVEPDEVGPILRAHDVFVQVSDFEGTSTSMLEALANGVVPAVTLASSGVAGVVSDGVDAMIVPVGDMRALAQRIAVLHQDRPLLARMSRKARETGEAYGWAKYRERLLEILYGALERQVPRSWPRWRNPNPPFGDWPKCWDTSLPIESGRLNAIPMPEMWRYRLRRLIRRARGAGA
jgi:glycosyltransferase involved in cell wall biosynthesis